MSQTIVIKLSGKLLVPEYLSVLAAHLSELVLQSDTRICLVHGGGTTLDEWLSVWGFETEKTQGVRHTPEKQMPVVLGTLAGYCNAQVVGGLLSHQIPAVGLTLADAFSFSVPLPEKLANYGKVAEVTGREDALLNLLMNNKKIPVLSSVAHHVDAHWFNVNADQAALALAKLVRADELWLLSDVDGVLDANGKVIAEISVNSQQSSPLPDSVTGGMHVKLLSAIEVVKSSCCVVTIANGSCAKTIHSLFSSLASDNPSLDHRRCGTRICA